MNKNILIFILLIFLFATVMVCVFRPKTHKPIVFENQYFKIELISQEVQAPKNPEIDFQSPSVNIELPPVTIETPNLNVNVSAPKSNVKSEKSEKSVAKTAQKKQEQQATTQIVSKKKEAKSDNKKTETSTKPDYKIVKNTKLPKANYQENKVNKEPELKASEPIQPKTKVLSEEEEIIAWNKWRSDLQNKLMSDSKIAAPIGTTFAFSFTVDKFGTITNLKTWSTNPSYTPLAVRVIKPLLLSYQKTAILNFPLGSKRVITNVNGGFTMARSSRYSSPSDYNDYERVTK